MGLHHSCPNSNSFTSSPDRGRVSLLDTSEILGRLSVSLGSARVTIDIFPRLYRYQFYLLFYYTYIHFKYATKKSYWKTFPIMERSRHPKSVPNKEIDSVLTRTKRWKREITFILVFDSLILSLFVGSGVRWVLKQGGFRRSWDSKPSPSPHFFVKENKVRELNVFSSSETFSLLAHGHHPCMTI